ncbi:MAG: polyphenol oxidase family protein, partial [Deltaproteobacteria bacterium]|nr:polyphenol oxidase family protein [Deltaproteobacteria bacterium]
MHSKLLDQIKNIKHGFGTKDDPIPKNFKSLWHLMPKWKQTHSTDITVVHKPNQSCGEVDGLYTSQKATPLAIITADCVPILLANKVGDKVAALHAGWRGTKSKIVFKFLELLKQQGEKP